MSPLKSAVSLRLCLLTLCIGVTACAPAPIYVEQRPASSRDVQPMVARQFNERSADRHSELRCMALNLYWEARGEGRKGMFAVGWVVLNRVESPEFPNSVCGVVLQGGEKPPCQFSWWCDGRSDSPRELDSWREVQAVAATLLRAPPRDPTNGSLFYHSTSISTPWLRARQRTARIGRHVFYR